MEELDIPILKKAYDLYKTIYGLRLVASKQTRHGLWQQIENTVLALVVCFFRAWQSERTEKKPHLEEASTELNLLRLLIRLARDVGTIELKQYVQMQTIIDEIGRMLGGWIKSVTPKVNPPPPEELKKEERKCRTEDSQMLSLALSSQLLLTLSRPSFQLSSTRLSSAT